ncbi:MAG: hypothetical protein HY000_28835 [Planctomycetes bacterium]|nr:hypothetical protein [Planctomycetota bacterium]
MFLALLGLLGVGLLAILLVVALVWFDLASGNAERALMERQKTVRFWQPPFVRGSDLANWAREMATQLVGKWLASKPTAATPGGLAAELHKGATRAMVPLVPDPETQRVVACPAEGQGMIGVTVPEVLEIAEYIRRNLPPAERDRIHDLALHNAKKLNDVDHSHFNAAETPCPLQGDDQVCRVYVTRPLRCRPLHLATIARELGLEAPASGGESPPWASHEQSVEQGIEEGVACSLKSAGLDANLYELNSALVTALDTPDAAQRWISGEDVFARGCALYR